ncbi:MAG: MFS transporter [Chloroflexi bacterium]|nr:MFS transporter [Chloroflexota bacterium]
MPATKRLGGAILAGYPDVFAAPPFRSLFFVLLLCGTASGMSMSYVSVWAANTFGIGPQAVAMLFIASGMTGAIANPLLGLLSDRRGWRRQLIVGQLALMSLAYLGYTQATTYAVGVGLVAFSGLGVMGLAMAMVNDFVRALPETERRNVARILAVERTGWSIGIIIGPAGAAAIVTTAGGTLPVFVAAAAIQLVAGALVCTLRTGTATRRRATSVSTGAESARSSASIPTMALVQLVAALVLVMLPSQTRTMYLALFVTKVLGEPAGTVGPLFALNAVVAVLTMPYVGAAADRFGAHRVLYVGVLVGIVYCTLQTFAASYAQTLAIQTLIGFGIALWSTSALIYLQQLMPARAGTAGGLYIAVQQLAPVLSGLLLGPIAEALGIPSAFAATAALGVAALALFATAHRAVAVRPPPVTAKPPP